MSQDKVTGDMSIKDASGNTVLKLDITDGESTVDGVQLNYFASLCDDKLNDRSFKDGDCGWRAA